MLITAEFNNGTTTGTFTFTIAGKPPITVPIAGETTSATMTLAAGTYDLTVQYSGDANNLPATSTSIRFVVTPTHRRSVRH